MSLPHFLWQDGFRGFTPVCLLFSNPKWAAALDLKAVDVLI